MDASWVRPDVRRLRQHDGVPGTAVRPDGRGVAEDAQLASLLLHAPPAQRQPVLLFACVHALLLGGDGDELARHYPNLTAHPDPGDPLPALRRVCEQHEASLAAMLASRHTQTNEIGRCALLLPAFGLLGGRGRPARPPRRRIERRAQPADRPLPLPLRARRNGRTVVVPDRARVRDPGRRPRPGVDPHDRHPPRHRPAARRRHRRRRGPVAGGVCLAGPARPLRPPAGRDRDGPDRRHHRPGGRCRHGHRTAGGIVRRVRASGRHQHVGAQLPRRGRTEGLRRVARRARLPTRPVLGVPREPVPRPGAARAECRHCR